MPFPRLVSTAVLLCLLGAGCGGEPGATSERVPVGVTAQPDDAATATARPSGPVPPIGPTGPPDPPEVPATVAPASCQDVQEVPIQGGEHLIGDSAPPVPYNSTPPTSGWHASGAFEVMVQPTDQPLSEPHQVSVLEAGGVVVSYAGLDDDARTALEQHVTANYSGRVAVTGYEPLSEGEVVFTSWGLLQRCQGLDLTALDAFVNANVDAEVTTGHDH